MQNASISRPLTAKQSRFIDEWMIDMNGAAAAERCGYSKKTSRAIAWELLTKPDIQAELQRRLDDLHPADIAYILEALPQNERRLVWNLVDAEQNGEILLQVSDSVRESLIQNMNKAELLAAAEVVPLTGVRQVGTV